MKKLILREIAGPLSRRFGTVAAGFIAGVMAVEPQLAERVEVAVGALVLVALDLAASYFDRKTREAD